MELDIQAIHTEAKTASITAEADYIAKYGEQAYCGFGWVEVYVERTNSKLAKALIAVGFSKSYKAKCLTLWTTGTYHGQSMDVKEAGSDAYAKVLKTHGLRAYACSRAD